MKRKHGPYREGRVHVVKEKCATCIFHPGNLMELHHGRVAGMVQSALKHDSAIICHETLCGPREVCRGFFDAHRTGPLQIAERLGMIAFDEELDWCWGAANAR